jgi:pimeloyl-ACP methyl ester carboxylesterase
VPDAVLRTITGCGHIPQEEQPQATLAAMEAFLGDALPTDPR